MGDEQVYLCMIAHGYAFKGFCGSEGWLKPDCYRLKYKTEGVDIFDAGSGRRAGRVDLIGTIAILPCLPRSAD